VAPGAVLVVVFVEAVDVLEVVVVVVVLVVVVPEPPEPLKVEPISPQRMLEKTTWVVGFCALIRSGFPSVLLQGPELPLSSQFMKPLASFQILKMRTMPRPSALPMVVSPPKVAAELSTDVHQSSVMELTPAEDTALAITLPFWMYCLRISDRVPVVVPSLVINCVVMVKGLEVSTVPPGPQ
jgi:hypothetical protein